MTSILDIGENGVDPHTEVKKLQDLVKKLETQNEVLRRKQKLPSTGDNDTSNESENGVLKPALNNSVFYNTRKQSEKRDIANVQQENLETVDLIDVNTSLTEDEDTWLFSSPRPPTPQQHRVSPYKWVRQDFDHPSPDVQSARKSLKYKLDEAARMSRSNSTPAFQNYSTPPQNNIPAMSLSADSTPSPKIMKPSARPSMAYNSSLPGSKLNTGTFTRPKKARDKPSLTDADVEVAPVHHPNVADIENLAKMQEESLRQSIAQTSPRRDEHGRRDSNNSVGSDHSSPPDSPHGSSQHLHSHSHTGVSNLRGSLPNVSRLIPRSQHHNSDSSLADFQANEEQNYHHEEPRYTSHVPQKQIARPSSPSVSGLKQPGHMVRGSSPSRSGLPTARRSIPRPGSAGPARQGAITPKRISGLPAPGGGNRNGPARPRQGQDNSWREGCF